MIDRIWLPIYGQSYINNTVYGPIYGEPYVGIPYMVDHIWFHIVTIYGLPYMIDGTVYAPIYGRPYMDPVYGHLRPYMVIFTTIYGFRIWRPYMVTLQDHIRFTLEMYPL